MASSCIVCNKGIGLFSGAFKNFLTDDADKRLCRACAKKVNDLQNQKNSGKAVEEMDFSGIDEYGREIVEKFITELPACEVKPESEQQASEKEPQDIMDYEVGDAVVAVTYQADENAVEQHLTELKAITDGEIEKYLEGKLSEGTEPSAFCEEVMTLNNDELKAVIADQREYYNDAEWAYILFVNDVRENRREPQPAEKEPQPVVVLDEAEADETEVEKYMSVHSDKTEEELREIYADDSYTLATRVAAKRLLEKLGE